MNAIRSAILRFLHLPPLPTRDSELNTLVLTAPHATRPPPADWPVPPLTPEVNANQ
jgi:hypothetical protein